MKFSNIQHCFYIILLFLLCGPLLSAQIIFVDDNAPGLNNGTSWENAYIYLQDALYDAANAEKPIEIHVAQGVYKPDKGANVTTKGCNSTFELLNGVTISGGYAGFIPDQNQIDPNERDIELYQSILSGDLIGNDTIDFDPNNLVFDPNFFDNSFHVVTASFTDETSTLDGFTITAGNAGISYLNNNSKSRGGGIYIESANGGPVISNCIFTINAAYEGGAIYSKLSDPNISNCKFILNSANHMSIAGAPVGGYGGAIYNTQSNPIVRDCEFIENLASFGGAVSNYNNSNTFIRNCIFERNIANVNIGGGIFNYDSDPIIQDCNFVKNLTTSHGGAIANTNNANPVLDNCIFQANQANSSGGAIYYLYSNEPNITNCIFEENYAGIKGGAITSDNSDPNLTNCIFSGNSSRYSGAFENAYGNIKFSSCIFFSNNSAINGGAIQNFSGDLFLKNCILSGNKAKTSGGALFNLGGNATLINCTITGNYAGYLGLFAYNLKSPPPLLSSSNIVLLNCIIWNGENAIFNQKDSTVTIKYSDVQNSYLAVNTEEKDLTWGNGNIDADPLFIEPGYWVDVNDPNIIVEPNDPNAFWLDGDYHLKSTAGHYDPNSQTWISDDVNSPCLDSGDPNSPLGNEQLPHGNRINMGAYGGTNQASLSYEPPDANKEPDDPNDF